MNTHERAKELIIAGAATAEEQRWLGEHLAGCVGCAALLARTQALRSALRSAPVTADAAMVEATKQRLLRHALELAERESRRWMLTASVAMAALFAWISVPLLWQAASWVGERTSSPAAATVTVFLGVAFLPALLAAAGAFWLSGAKPAELERTRR